MMGFPGFVRLGINILDINVQFFLIVAEMFDK